MAEALERDDEKAFLQAVSDLELAGPVRAVSAQQPADDPEEEPVQERINEMIHILTPARPVRPKSDDPPAAG